MKEMIYINKQVFIINGSGGVGKDTFVSFIVKGFEHNVMNFSSIDKVKEIAKIIGWDGSKSEKNRKLLSDLKLLCTNYNNMPFKSLEDKVEEFKNSDSDILFLHIREPEEIEKAKKAFGAKTVLIKRNSIKQITSNMADGRVFDYNYDIVVNNDESIDAFHRKAIQFAMDLYTNNLKNQY